MAGHGVIPCKRLVDARGRTIRLESEILRAVYETQMRAAQRGTNCHANVGFGVSGCWLWIRWFEAETAGNLNCAKNDLQCVQRAAGLEPVGMGRDSAHGMERNRAARHRLVSFTAKVCPFVVQFKRFVKGNAGDFGSNGADALGGDTAALCDSLRGVFIA